MDAVAHAQHQAVGGYQLSGMEGCKGFFEVLSAGELKEDRGLAHDGLAELCIRSGLVVVAIEVRLLDGQLELGQAYLGAESPAVGDGVALVEEYSKPSLAILLPRWRARIWSV
jgi:hypothetical protein